MNIKVDPKTTETINKLKNDLLSLSNITANAIGGVLGRSGYYGRYGIIDVEEKYFNFGKAYSKNGRGNVRKHTKYDNSDGWIILGKRTKMGNPYRLVQYSFEGAHALRSRAAFQRSVRRAYVSSKMLNLWENDTQQYSAPSREIYYGRQGFKWQKGDIRKGKNFYMANYHAVEKAIPKAIAKTEIEIERQISGLR